MARDTRLGRLVALEFLTETGSNELATGEQPLAPRSREALAAVADLAQPMPSARARHPELGKLAAIIDRCLIKSKADRVDSARALLAELEAVARPGRASAEDEDASPYPGLTAFQERDADRFFGRERMVQHVLGRLEEQPLVAVVGPSGAVARPSARAPPSARSWHLARSRWWSRIWRC